MKTPSFAQIDDFANLTETHACCAQAYRQAEGFTFYYCYAVYDVSIRILEHTSYNHNSTSKRKQTKGKKKTGKQIQKMPNYQLILINGSQPCIDNNHEPTVSKKFCQYTTSQVCRTEQDQKTLLLPHPTKQSQRPRFEPASLRDRWG